MQNVYAKDFLLMTNINKYFLLQIYLKAGFFYINSMTAILFMIVMKTEF